MHPKPKTDQQQVTVVQPLLLRIRFFASTWEELIKKYHQDVLPGGMFIRTGITPPFKPGTLLKICFQLMDGPAALSGAGIVAWLDTHAHQKGFVIRFYTLSPALTKVYQKMMQLKSVQTLQLRRVSPAGTSSQQGNDVEFSEMVTRHHPAKTPPFRLRCRS